MTQRKWYRRLIDSRMRHLVTVATLFIVPTLQGCGDRFTDPVVPYLPPDNVFWQLEINYPAINLAVAAPYNTVHLEAIPMNARGVPLSEWSGTIQWQVLDTANLRIDSDGNLQALGTGTNMRVIAAIQINGVTRSDTAYVRVTATPPASPVKSISIQPPFDEAYQIPMGEFDMIFPTIQTEAGGTLSGLQVGYRSADSSIVSISNEGATDALMTPNDRGETWVYGETYAYGVHVIDSARVRVLPYLLRVIDIVMTAPNRISVFPDSVTVITGGSVFWRDYEERWHTNPAPAIIFSDPSKASRSFIAEFLGIQPAGDEGNIPSRPSVRPPFQNRYFGVRDFMEPGVYTYKVGPDSVRGVIVVQDE
jgi:hypothetical protein